MISGSGIDAGIGSDGSGSSIGSDAGGIGSDAGGIGSDAGGIGSDAGGIGSDAGGGDGSGSCTTSLAPEPPRPPDPDPQPDPGPAPDQCTYDTCQALASGQLGTSGVSQQTLDQCNGVSPAPSSCVFTPYPSFYLGENGCSVSEPSAGDLGNFRFDCPTDPYEQQALCEFALATLQPVPPQIDPTPWEPGVGSGSGSGSGSVSDDFQNPNPGNANRNVVVIGSSMLATHNQVNNGPQCARFDINGRVLTAADDRNLVGNDFTASPAWSTRVPWLRVFRGARTGHKSGDVRSGTMNTPTPDTCGQNWNQNVSPMTAGVNWFAGKSNRLMITDGGLINDQKNVAGQSWTDTLASIVTCQALDRATGLINTLLDWDHWVQNWGWAGWLENRRWVWRQAPTVRLQRTSPVGGWAQALDAPANMRRPRCQFVVQIRGNGRMPAALPAVLAIGKDVTPLERLWRNGPAGSPVPGNLTAIKQAYVGVSKQAWLQYPYMDSAQVAIRGSDLGLLWNGGAAGALVRAWGRNIALRINAIDPGIAPRIRQVTDDLNELMYISIGCNGAAAFAANHPARVCQRDAAMNPIVVITQSNFAGWGAGDHQDTIIGGMPHESAAGANKLGAALVAADALP
ncbi:MAG TPA: hypothetical protein VF516_44540 [Kofleriaceae bacterium]